MTELEKLEHGQKMVSVFQNVIFGKFLKKFESDKRYIVTDYDGDIYFETDDWVLAKEYCFEKSVTLKFVVDLGEIENMIAFVFDKGEWCDVRPFCLREE